MSTCLIDRILAELLAMDFCSSGQTARTGDDDDDNADGEDG